MLTEADVDEYTELAERSNGRVKAALAADRVHKNAQLVRDYAELQTALVAVATRMIVIGSTEYATERNAAMASTPVL